MSHYILCDAAWCISRMFTTISRQLNFLVSSRVIHSISLQQYEWKQIKLLCFAHNSSADVCMWCGHVTTHALGDSVWFTLLRERVWFILILAMAATLKQTLLQHEWWFKERKKKTKHTLQLRHPLRPNQPSSSTLIYPEPAYSLSAAACEVRHTL